MLCRELKAKGQKFIPAENKKQVGQLIDGQFLRLDQNFKKRETERKATPSTEAAPAMLNNNDITKIQNVGGKQ